MNVEDLVKLNSTKVRSDSHLMRLYIEMFKAQFGKVPNCAGCTFSTDFHKLKSAVDNKKTTFAQTIKMENTYQIKVKTGEILHYRNNGRIVRRFDTSLTLEFVIGFLTHGTEEQLKERRKLFSKIPDCLNEVPKVDEFLEEEKTSEQNENKETDLVTEEVNPDNTEQTDEVVIDEEKETESENQVDEAKAQEEKPVKEPKKRGPKTKNK